MDLKLKRANGSRVQTEILWEWEKAFRENDCGWRGSDCAFSIPVGPDRSIWLFGDTFIQQDPKHSGRSGARIINNSIGIQHGPWKGPETKMMFHWNNTGENPRSFFIDAESSGFLWPLSGAVVKGRLLVFAIRIIHDNPEKVFGFQAVGNELIVIENPDAAPEEWNIRYHPFPWPFQKVGWGSTVLSWEGDLYVYGFLKKAKSWRRRIHLVAARIRSAEESDFSSSPFTQWEFFDGSSSRWSGDFHDLRPIHYPSTTEFSIHFDAGQNKFIWFSYSKYPGKTIFFRLSEGPVGPFSKARTVFHTPEPSWNRHFFSYAAKIHPELSCGNGDAILTYMTNSRVLWECIDDMRIYFPRFVRIVQGRTETGGRST